MKLEPELNPVWHYFNIQNHRIRGLLEGCTFDEKGNVRNAVEAASMFAGFKIVPETNYDMQNLGETETACISNNGPVDVISINGGLPKPR